MSKVIITLNGKAKQVFSYLSLLAKHQGNKTLGEIASEQRTSKRD